MPKSPNKKAIILALALAVILIALLFITLAVISNDGSSGPMREFGRILRIIALLLGTILGN